MIAWWLAVLACGGTPTAQPTPAPTPSPAPVAEPSPAAGQGGPHVLPVVAFRMPKQTGRTPQPLAASPELKAARDRLRQVVMDHARDPNNPWAVVHGMLALGVAEPLTNGRDPVDWLFETYGQIREVEGTPLLGFPTSQGAVRVEPHTDLILKALAEGGVAPDRQVMVKGRSFQVAELYRGSLEKAWVKGTTTSFQDNEFNDTPWALQGLATWAPAELEWTAAGGRKMTMDGFTDAIVEVLVHETRTLTAARAAGQTVQKDTRQGIFRYTCGGQHLIQGAAYAVARGYGDPAHRQTMCDQKDLLRWRIDVELAALDPALQSGQYDAATNTLLLTQRLKFLGHWLETTHKMLAMGLCPPTPEDAAATKRVADEIVRTVAALEQLGAFTAMPTMTTDPAYAKVPRGPEQLFLDLVGDSAHAVRGIDLATGAGTIAY
ncbi:MAG: hypothetical protein H6738_14130 [Alphaproteobacteria bacterium]|nr:hypothetical protein [Alphaproteobacteria bacterium]MCB9697913.1 hypothetical protein [Alphaproteobacteria bacterium]